MKFRYPPSPIVRLALAALLLSCGVLLRDFVPGELPRSLALILGLLALAGGAMSLLFLRRADDELDPGSVIPPRVRRALDALAEGLVVLDAQERIVFANTAFATRIGRPAEGLVDGSLATLGWLPPEGKTTLPPLPWLDVLTGHKPEARGELRSEAAGRQALTFAVHAVAITAEDGTRRGAVVTFDDLTDVEQANGELRRALQKIEGMQRDLARQNQALLVLATRDALTEVLNRRALFDAFENLFGATRDGDSELSCIMVDIDRFKAVNDRYGHGVGDKVIRMVADVLAATARATDLVGRYGGEEFCVLLPQTTLDEARAVAERIRLGIQHEVGAKFSTPLTITASFGVSSTRHGAAEALELCNQADRALYLAKESGRNRVATWPEVVAQAQAPPAAAGPASLPQTGPPAAVEQALRERITALERALGDRERAGRGVDENRAAAAGATASNPP